MRRQKRGISILLGLFASVSANAQNLQLIDWFAGGDIVGTGVVNDSEGVDSYASQGMRVREFEFSANAQIDHTWEGVMTLAYHEELTPGEQHVEVHEAFVFSPKVLEMATLKLGKFFLGVGRLNRFHLHDWVFTEAPLYHKDFFGYEGVNDTGVEYSKLLGGDLNWRITLGLVSGEGFSHGHDHEDEAEEGETRSSFAPTGYLRISAFNELATTEGFETGLNWLARSDGEGGRYHYAGLDFIYKKRTGRYLSHLFQSELWSKTFYAKGEHDGQEDLGAYFFYQMGINQHHAIGLRYDFFRPKTDADHAHVDVGEFHVNDDYNAYTLSYTYFNSEFMRTRFSVEHSTGHELHDDEIAVTRMFAQLVFLVGAHPAHVY